MKIGRSIVSSTRGPLDALVFSSANSRAYLSALFAAWRQNQIVAALPRTPEIKTIPGVRAIERHNFADDSGWFGEKFTPIYDDSPALIAFSSGTTGRPKSLLMSHRALADVVQRINSAMGIDETIREYIGVPVFYSFGAGRARAVAAAGGRSFLPAHGFDPAEIAHMLASGEINAISAVPTLWRIILQNPEVIGENGKNVRWIEIGSQYISGSEKQSLKELFPRARIVQHYGLTEASRTTLLDVTESEGAELESVGRVTGNVEVAIDDDGAIKIRGPHLASGLISGAGVKPIIDRDGWLVTADRGRLENGFLYYEGRSDELINSGGLKIDPTRFERRLAESLDGSGSFAVARLADSMRGERVLVAIEHGAFSNRALVETSAVEVAREFGLAGAGALAFREVTEIPRTPTGKVQRKLLAQMPEVRDAPTKTSGAVSPTPNVDAVAKAAELQKLWADVLDLEKVSLNESFYDLGGDSLSALTAIIRMEALGLEPEVARGILEGRTIAEMAVPEKTALSPSVSESPDPEQPPTIAQNSKTTELLELWAEVLGVDHVSIHESFYDLGGDSLSALTVIIRMEALGLEPEVARGIFDGKTISELVEEDPPLPRTPITPAAGGKSPEAEDPAPAETSETSRKHGLTLAETMNAVHATRGLLILWVVVVHWLPGVLARLPGTPTWIYNSIEPILRFGTPGFAIVFGLGIGALGIAQHQRDPARFLRGTRINAMLVLVGVLLLALFRFGAAWSAGALNDPELPSELFYSAISFYALAMLTMPFVIRLCQVGSSRTLTLFAVMVAAMAIHAILEVTIAPFRPGGVLELFKILLTAKYGYFQMMGFVMAGAAMGYLFRARHDQPNLARSLVLAGSTLGALGFVILFEAEPDAPFSRFGQVRPWHLMIYAGSALLFMSGFVTLNRNGGKDLSNGLKLFNAIAIASGILALPIFVGHELVIPAKDLLANLGVPEFLALAFTLGLFLAGLGYAYRRLMRFLLRAPNATGG